MRKPNKLTRWAAVVGVALLSSPALADDADTERARTFFNAGAQAYAAMALAAVAGGACACVAHRAGRVATF